MTMQEPETLREVKPAHLVAERVKYPRTPHLPWSPGLGDNDRRIETLDAFHGRRVIVTSKMDGENTSLYRTGMHARSLDSRHHPGREWLKGFWGAMRMDIPDRWRVCGENLFATHSIRYRDLASFFPGFSVWNARNVCLGCEETVEWFALLGIEPVPVLYDGKFDAAAIQALWRESEREWTEGYVIRVADEIRHTDFRRCVAKFVRSGHVQTDERWMHNHAFEQNHMREQAGEPQWK
ncbi:MULTISPECIES: RNA ligase family protein [Cupriavidus]|uniref:RNA ligase family protein n=1 Tax=Cupriavidus sp. SK-3 TaxID=1470558 RepID=UPI00044939BE|nr:RNA ligase family protein [Cupriavidus sp. SK-3]KDP84393.1 hypothetical protein CF70_019545 [Cupriavidus sp. SK-3]